jgi:hypothetical protein
LAAGAAIADLATEGYAFRSYFASPFFTEIEFSVGTVNTQISIAFDPFQI